MTYPSLAMPGRVNRYSARNADPPTLAPRPLDVSIAMSVAPENRAVQAMTWLAN